MKIIYDAQRVYDSESTCLNTAEQSLSKTPPHITAHLKSLNVSCLFIPDTRGS